MHPGHNWHKRFYLSAEVMNITSADFYNKKDQSINLMLKIALVKLEKD